MRHNRDVIFFSLLLLQLLSFKSQYFFSTVSSTFLSFSFFYVTLSNVDLRLLLFTSSEIKRWKPVRLIIFAENFPLLYYAILAWIGLAYSQL